MSELLVIARLRIAAGNEEAVATAVPKLITAARQEPGVLFFAGYRSSLEPRDYVLVERYVSSAAFDEHLASAHYQSIAGETILPLLEDRTIELFDPLTDAGQ
jgi:quinol monooxygenase YgiN